MNISKKYRIFILDGLKVFVVIVNNNSAQYYTLEQNFTVTCRH